MALLQGADIFQNLAAKDGQRVIKIIERTIIDTDYPVFYRYVPLYSLVCSSERNYHQSIQEAQLLQRKRASNIALSYGAKGIRYANRLSVDHKCDRQTNRRTDGRTDRQMKDI